MNFSLRSNILINLNKIKQHYGFWKIAWKTYNHSPPKQSKQAKNEGCKNKGSFFHLASTEKCLVNILIPFLICKSLPKKRLLLRGLAAIELFFGNSMQVHANTLSPFSMSSGTNWGCLGWAFSVPEMPSKSPDICKWNFWLACYSLSIVRSELDFY